MRKIIILILVIILIGCEKVPSEPVVVEEVECVTDSDCITGGCSGTVCQSKDSEPIFTTCEFLPEYACYKEIRCGCIEGKCHWDKTTAFDECVEEARESSVEVVT